MDGGLLVIVVGMMYTGPGTMKTSGFYAGL
jgi:hypothetical protein